MPETLKVSKNTIKDNDKKVIVWTSEVIDLIDGKHIGGIAVQMYFWAQVFREHGWKVYALSGNGRSEKEGIVFLSIRKIRRINMLLEWWFALKYILNIHPELVIFRGANRALLPLAVFSKIFGVKLLLFGASDVNFEPGKEITAKGFNRTLFQWSLPLISYFVAQNSYQQNTLKQNYKKDSIVLFNIWNNIHVEDNISIAETDVIWVANFRKLKRAEWILEAAKRLPSIKFTLIGGKGEEEYYKSIEVAAKELSNVCFLGPKPFFFCNQAIQHAKVLLCSSTLEGFPNTFLQAWTNHIPVISTVDPNHLIEKNNLGRFVKTIDEFIVEIQTIITDKVQYNSCVESIDKYFVQNHSSVNGYNKLIEFLYESH